MRRNLRAQIVANLPSAAQFGGLAFITTGAFEIATWAGYLTLGAGLLGFGLLAEYGRKR